MLLAQIFNPISSCQNHIFAAVTAGISSYQLCMVFGISIHYFLADLLQIQIAPDWLDVFCLLQILNSSTDSQWDSDLELDLATVCHIHLVFNHSCIALILCLKSVFCIKVQASRVFDFI